MRDVNTRVFKTCRAMSDDAFRFDLEVRDPARVLVSPLKVPGLGNPAGLLVLRDGTLVISTTCPLRSSQREREYKMMKISQWGQEIPLDLGPGIWLNLRPV
jgi:hypothetical protein